MASAISQLRGSTGLLEKEEIMCFRPAGSEGSGPMKCPECGKPIQMMGGIVLKACPFCKCDFTPYLDGTKPLPDGTVVGGGAPGAPAAPGAPKAPGAPGAPAAPKAPGK